MHRPYRQTVTDTDHRSTPGHRVANRNHQRRRRSNVDMGRNEPKRIEIGPQDAAEALRPDTAETDTAETDTGRPRQPVGA